MILRFPATLILISIGLSACRRDVPADLHQARKAEVSINLGPLGINRSESFKEVRVNALPVAVLDQMGPVADKGERFNSSDVAHHGLPMTGLLVAAVSEHYCTLTYWKGGMEVTFNTKVFELSDGSARLIWHSRGQGGFYLEDLKEMIESGRMHNDLRSAK